MRERLGGEHDLDPAAGEQVLDGLLEQGQHARVVRGDPAHQPLDERVVAEHVEVLGGDRGAPLLGDAADVGALGRRGQPHPGAQALLHGRLAADTGEDEHDRGQQTCLRELVDHDEPWDGSHTAGRSVVPGPAGPSARGAPVAVPAAAPQQVGEVGVDGWVDTRVRGVHVPRVQVEQLVTDEHVLAEGHRTVLADDDGGVAAHRREPVAELLGVGHGRRQRDELHVVREVDDDLLPHGAAEAVGEVVDLVHDDVPEAVERRRAGVEHVAQHLGRHDDDVGVTVDGGVTGEQTDAVGAVDPGQVGVLLVGQRLDGCGVERLAARDESQVHGELADDRLAGTRGGGDEHAAAALEGGARLDLEVVEREVQALAEDRELAAVGGGAAARGGVPLGR